MVWAFGSAVLLGIPLAIVIQALRVPDRFVPTAPPKDQRALLPLVISAISSPQASNLELTSAEVNAHIAQALLPPRASAGDWTLQRVAVRFEPSKCEVLTLQKWQGWDVYLNATYAVTLKNGKTRLTPISGNLGRLSLGPFWMEQFERPFLHLLPPLRKERVLFDRLKDLRIEPERLVLSVSVTAGMPDSSKP